jgi:transposase
MYAEGGRPSIPPERLLKASLLMALYSVRSERPLCEQLGYNLLFRWFLDMDMVEESSEHRTFSKNRDRLMRHEVAAQFFGTVVAQAKAARLMSAEHFSVDGTLIDAWASMKSVRPKDEGPTRPSGGAGGDSNRWVDFHGEKRSNETHESKTDPEAKLMRKGPGREAKLCYSAHALMESRNGLLVEFRVAPATGRAERETALSMLDDALPGSRPLTLGADRGYDTRDFVRQCRGRHVTPHVAQNTKGRRSAIDGRTSSTAGYAVSQRLRMRIEEVFGWVKTVGNFARTKLRGLARTQHAAYLVASAFNLVRMARLLRATA